MSGAFEGGLVWWLEARSKLRHFRNAHHPMAGSESVVERFKNKLGDPSHRPSTTLSYDIVSLGPQRARTFSNTPFTALEAPLVQATTNPLEKTSYSPRPKTPNPKPKTLNPKPPCCKTASETQESPRLLQLAIAAL